MADWNIYVDLTNDIIGRRALSFEAAGSELAPVYRLSLGGSLYKEIKQRVDGVATGNSTTGFPSGFAMGRLDNSALPLVSTVADDDVIDLNIIDPNPSLGTVNAIRTEAMP